MERVDDHIDVELVIDTLYKICTDVEVIVLSWVLAGHTVTEAAGHLGITRNRGSQIWKQIIKRARRYYLNGQKEETTNGSE